MDLITFKVGLENEIEQKQLLNKQEICMIHIQLLTFISYWLCQTLF